MLLLLHVRSETKPRRSSRAPNHPPACPPALLSACSSAAENNALPAGISPDAVSNGSVASWAPTPSPTSSLIVRTAVGESTSSAYQSASPVRMPPSTSSVRVTGVVDGANPPPRSIVTTSAPHRKPLLHAPGG